MITPHVGPGSTKLRSLKVPQEIQEACASLDQSLKATVELTSSIKEIVHGEGSLLELIAKGFKVDLNLSLISNMKQAILEKLKDEDS